MPPLSIAIITFNEERNVGRCLDSIEGLSDDVIVVDSFSTDRTEAICSRFPGLRFIQRPWQGYSAAKNFANACARRPYILSLDADEALSEELRASIEQISPWEGIYGFNVLTNYCGTWVRHGGWYPGRKLRLFPKDQCRWNGDFVHERLEYPRSLEPTWLKGDLLHYSYHALSDHYEKIARYSDLHAQQLAARGKTPSVCREWLGPPFKFFRTYFLQLGCLDGKAGWNIARMSALAVSLKYQKLRRHYANERSH